MQYGTYYEVTKENILKRVSPFEIFRHYVPWFEVGRTIKTPFQVEKKASFWSKGFRDGGVFFKDFARGVEGDCFTLVMILRDCDFFQALELINVDMKLGLGPDSDGHGSDVKWHLQLMARDKIEAQATGGVNIHYRIREWRLIDHYFWYSHSVLRRVSKLLAIYPIDTFWIGDTYYKADKLAYAWDTPNGKTKIYQPLNKKDMKWRSNTSNEALQGEQALPEKGKLLLIQSSLKDIGCVLSRYGIPGVAPNGEHGLIPPIKLIDFENRFDRIGILYDNDKEGIKAAKNMASTTGYECFILPFIKESIKDPSDFARTGYVRILDEFFQKVVSYK